MNKEPPEPQPHLWDGTPMAAMPYVISKSTDTPEHRVYEGMKMSEHTDGPIRYEYEPGYCGELIAVDGMTVCAFTDEPSPENARRIVAAWNYCNGHSTDYLEKASATSETAGKTLMADFQRDVDRLSAINAELLEALEGLVGAEESMRATYTCAYGKTPEDDDHFGHEKWAGEFLLERANAARAAIAKAQGEQ